MALQISTGAPRAHLHFGFIFLYVLIAFVPWMALTRRPLAQPAFPGHRQAGGAAAGHPGGNRRGPDAPGPVAAFTYAHLAS